MNEYLEAYGRNSFAKQNPDKYLFASLLATGLGFALFALTGNNENDAFEQVERLAQEAAQPTSVAQTTVDRALRGIGVAGLGAVVRYFLGGRVTLRDLALPASFKYQLPSRPAC